MNNRVREAMSDNYFLGEGYWRDLFDALFFAAGAGIWTSSWLNWLAALFLALAILAAMRWLSPRIGLFLGRGRL